MRPAKERTISVTGLGYVGLPVAVAFARRYPVVAFDVDARRIDELERHHDRNNEVSADDLDGLAIEFTTAPERLARADFHIVAVPTPIDADRQPDLRLLRQASRSIGEHLKRGDVVVFESTVYPGGTEEECLPILEQSSGLRVVTDFGVGYAPERINPGDAAHRFETIRKVVSATDPATLKLVSEIYGSVVEAGVYEAPSIRVAEAAKVIENTQRDLNIALVNELAMIFGRLGIDTSDVLAAAETKWNFLPYRPGLVGGHCIGVDPYYLTHKAERAGYHPQVVLAGRATNDGMGRYVAQETIRLLLRHGLRRTPHVVILGLAYKEDVPDVRNSRVPDIVAELLRFGATVEVADPLAELPPGAGEFAFPLVALAELRPADAVILAVAHGPYLDGGWDLVRSLLAYGGVVMDVRARLDRDRVPPGVELWRL
jgi:UDP-N-acetyl-D-galactosamine dehydrogenase